MEIIMDLTEIERVGESVSERVNQTEMQMNIKLFALNALFFFSSVRFRFSYTYLI